MYCENCKQEFSGNFCPVCGSKLVEKPQQNDLGVNISDDAAIMGGVNVTRNESHNSTSYDQRVINNSTVTNNIVERQKTDAELRNERNIQFMEICKQVFSDGLLEEEEKRRLVSERVRLGIDETEAARLIEMARKSSGSRMTTLSMRDSMTLKTVDRYIDSNNTSVLGGQIPRLAALARNYKVDEVLYRYYMLLSALQPEELIREYETDTTDEYWKTYWAAIAYMKKGNVLSAEDAIVKLDLYPEYSEDNSLLLSAVSTYSEFGAEAASEYICAILPEHCSSLLLPFIHALFLEVDTERAAEVSADKAKCQFYIDNLVNVDSPAVKARKAAEEEVAARKAEEAAARKAEEEAAARKAEEEAAAATKTAATTTCPSCGEELTANAKFCLNCGAKIENKKETITCPSCGEELTAGAKFCLSCGAKIEKGKKDNIDAEELYQTGENYYYGKNGKEEDYSEAVEWYHKAAELGHVGAEYSLGYCYYYGQGVDMDNAEAVKWFGKAAEQGHARAQYLLGVCYYNGQGVDNDYEEAVKWYRKAAEQGDEDAQYDLGRCYENGDGVSIDITEAVKWYRKAAEQGHEDAAYKFQQLADDENNDDDENSLYKIENDTLILLDNGDSYMDDNEKQNISGSFTKIKFPGCYEDLYDDDFDACREQLAKVTTLDFSDAPDLKIADDTFTGAASLEVVVLPKNCSYIPEFKECPKLKEIHIYNMENSFTITDDEDERLVVYASNIEVRSFDNGFLMDVKRLYVPANKIDEVRECLEEYDDELDVRPLPEGYRFPTKALSKPWSR